MNNLALFIDGQNLAYRAKFKFNLSTPAGLDSSVFYGFIYILKSYLVRFKPNRVFVVFDHGRAPFRLSLLPTYKAREDKLGEDKAEFYSQIRDLKEVLAAMGVYTFMEENTEADDILYQWSLQRGKNPTIIVSSDKDFIPYLSQNLSVFNPFKDKLIGCGQVPEEYGFEVSEFLDYLILNGDKSDKIPGVRGLAEKRIRKFLDEYGSIEDYLDDPTGSFESFYPQIQEVYKRNKKLIDLRYSLIQNRKIGSSFPLPTFDLVWDDPTIREYFHKYRTGSFYRKDFLKSFKELI